MNNFHGQISQENSSPYGEDQETLTFNSREHDGTMNMEILKTVSQADRIVNHRAGPWSAPRDGTQSPGIQEIMIFQKNDISPSIVSSESSGRTSSGSATMSGPRILRLKVILGRIVFIVLEPFETQFSSWIDGIPGLHDLQCGQSR